MRVVDSFKHFFTMIYLYFLFQIQEELFTAKNNYEALNQQLLEELPILLDAATNILVNCINTFASARKLLNGKITKQYLTLCEVYLDKT